MLWFDNDPKSELHQKLERAADYYRTKYGKAPTVCFVHPSMLPAATGSEPEPQAEPGATRLTLKNGGLELRSTRSVLPNHFWIGVNGNNLAGNALT
jgi:hypothetical protein